MRLTKTKFSRIEMETMPPAELAKAILALEAELTAQLLENKDFHAEIRKIIDELRSLGYDLWSFDEDDDFEVWCGDWTTTEGGKLILEFHRENGVQGEIGVRAKGEIGVRATHFTCAVNSLIKRVPKREVEAGEIGVRATHFTCAVNSLIKRVPKREVEGPG